MHTLAVTTVDWLLGLNQISSSDPRALLRWHYAVPAWVAALIVLLVVVFVFWSYSRLVGPRWARIALSTIRTALILVVIGLLLGPMLIVQRERQEVGWVVMLVDRSASMNIRDASSDRGVGRDDGEPATRDLALRQAVLRQVDQFGPERLGLDRQLRWLGFHDEVFDIEGPGAEDWSLDEPTGRTTAIRTAIDQALQQITGQRGLALVLFTDGRSPQATGPETIRRLKQSGMSVYPVPLGGMVMPTDLSIARVDAPDKVFIDDDVPLAVWVKRWPADGSIDPKQVIVRLIDPQQPDEPLDEVQLDEFGPSQPVYLTARWNTVGPATWHVEVEHRADDKSLRESTTANNLQPIHLEFVDRPIRVLYVEGVPRWEYRYLKNLFVRENNIDSSILLLSADRSFAQEGDRPITRLPGDAGEFGPYDVIVIGDVPPNQFSPTQLELIRDQVSLKGSGLLWIGGARFTPRTYAGTQLADLLPMREPNAVVDMSARSIGLKVQPSAAAEALSVLHLRGPQGRTDPRRPWPADLPRLHWAQAVGSLKPTTEILATVTEGDREPEPLLLLMRYGAGLVLYAGTDETWRWRRGRGELYFEQFWTQLIYLMGRPRIEQHDDGRGLALHVSHHRTVGRAPVIVSLSIEDAILAKHHLPKIEVMVESAEEPGRRLDHLELVRAKDDPRSGVRVGGTVRYESIWRPGTAGRFFLRVTQSQFEDLGVSWGPIEVVDSNEELLHYRPDHGRLEKLAEETGGRLVDLNEMGALAELIRKPDRMSDDVIESVWDSPLSLLIVLCLLTIEWVFRKWMYLP